MSVTEMSQRADWTVQLLLARHGELIAPYHRWLSEQDRWAELVLALLTRVTVSSEHRVREICHLLAATGFLELDRLSHLDGNTADSERLKALLVSEEFTSDEANRACEVLAEAANAITQKLDGKLQRRMREHGERIAHDLQETLALRTLTADESRHAIVFWLQNTCDLPLSLADAETLRYCEANNFSLDSLTAAADRADINVAFVDDLIHAELAGRQE